MSDPVLRLRIDLAPAEEIWEEGGGFPFRGPILRAPLAEYLENHARRARTAPSVDLTIRSGDAPLDAEAQAQFVRNYRSFFGVKFDGAELERAVNRREGLQSLYVGAATSLVALAFVAFVDVGLGFHTFAIYFVLLVLVWVLMWDSIEKLAFDSMFIRMRARALAKLRDAQVTFGR